MVCWLVGGKCVKRKLSKINFYQHQTLSNIKLDQYKQLFNQQKSSRPSREGSDRAIIFHLKSRTESPTVQTKELRIRFFFFSLLYIGAGPVWVVSGGAGPVWVVSGGRAGGRADNRSNTRLSPKRVLSRSGCFLRLLSQITN